MKQNLPKGRLTSERYYTMKMRLRIANVVLRAVSCINVYFMFELPVPIALLICYRILLYETR